MAEEPSVNLRTDVPHGPRIWNYWLGGKDNYAADRALGDAILEFFPAISDYAKKSRQFLVRAVRFLAGEARIDQFLDIGASLPTMQNTHEVAQGINPSARIVYVNNDPLVLAHARALLRNNTTAEGTTTYIDADYTDPQAIIDKARVELDFDRPIAVVLMAPFVYLDNPDDVRRVITTITAAVPPGSYLALWSSIDTSAEIRADAQAQADMGPRYALRTVEQIRRWFDGLDMVEPGLVQLPRWRPDVGSGRPAHYDGYGAVAIKP